jgi:twitching motility protein PilJ
MTFKLKLPAFLSRLQDAAGETLPTRTILDTGAPAKGRRPIPWSTALLHLSRLPVAKRLQILGGALVLVMLVIAVVVYRDNRQAGYNAAYIATAGDMRMLSQRLAKASSLALLGDPAAFRQLRESRDSFAGNIERLSNGGELASGWVPPSPGRVQPQLQALAKVWEKTDRNAARLLEMEKNLVSLGKEVAGSTTAIRNCSTGGTARRAEDAGQRGYAGHRGGQPARDADAADGEECERAPARRCDRPGSGLPARQGHQ